MKPIVLIGAAAAAGVGLLLWSKRASAERETVWAEPTEPALQPAGKGALAAGYEGATTPTKGDAAGDAERALIGETPDFGFGKDAPSQPAGKGALAPGTSLTSATAAAQGISSAKREVQLRPPDAAEVAERLSRIDRLALVPAIKSPQTAAERAAAQQEGVARWLSLSPAARIELLRDWYALWSRQRSEGVTDRFRAETGPWAGQWSSPATWEAFRAMAVPGGKAGVLPFWLTEFTTGWRSPVSYSEGGVASYLGSVGAQEPLTISDVQDIRTLLSTGTLSTTKTKTQATGDETVGTKSQIDSGFVMGRALRRRLFGW